METSEATLCSNCSTPMHGPYCALCGQKARRNIPTIGEAISELTEALIHADSRLWRTLRLLLFYPGELPKRYFAGHRASFLPPFRLYLLASLAFFLIMRIDGFLDPTDVRPTSLSADVVAGEPTPERGDPCDFVVEGAFKEYLGPRLQTACRQAMVDGGASLSQRFLTNLPTAMFLLMPLYATTMLLWYWWPRRYFMEHLIFQLFNHSALFLAAGALALGSWLLPPAHREYSGLAFVPYAIFYCVRSLRVYYGQSRAWTWFKFLSLMLVYFLLLGVVFIIAGIASVL